MIKENYKNHFAEKHREIDSVISQMKQELEALPGPKKFSEDSSRLENAFNNLKKEHERFFE